VNLATLLGKLKLYKVTNWDEAYVDLDYSEETRVEAELDAANVASSEIEGPFILTDLFSPKPKGPYHALLLDLDVPAFLVPSSTEGHSHLYVDVQIPEDDYFHLLDQLAKCGVIQKGYAEMSKRKGGTALRLPWIKKEAA
jgi:hypothetical protein